MRFAVSTTVVGLRCLPLLNGRARSVGSDRDAHDDPAFRQPLHSGWGYDETRALQYRRVDMYLTGLAVR